jgi:hypothetical protein
LGHGTGGGTDLSFPNGPVRNSHDEKNGILEERSIDLPQNLNLAFIHELKRRELRCFLLI